MSLKQLRYVPLMEFQRIYNLSVDLKQRATLISNMARINVLYMIKLAGSGHIGTSFSSVDIITWIYLNELKLGTKAEKADTAFFSSKGHDAPAFYAILTALEKIPFEKLSTFRQMQGLPGHPDVSIPFMESNTGSLGMGISKAKGMILARRLQKKNTEVFVLTGDGELQEGQFWESLATAVHQKLQEMIVIVDHNKIQSDTWVSQVNDLGELQEKLSAFGWNVLKCNGHDFDELDKVIEQAKTAGIPSIIIADTIKGQGVSFMESSALSPEGEAFYRYHSGAPNDEDYEKAVDELFEKINSQLLTLKQRPLALLKKSYYARSIPATHQRLITQYSQQMVNCAQNYPNLVVLDADLMIDCGLLAFKRKHPERFFECGIAEQDMVSQAGGMALKGLLPVIHSFACFLTPRANEQIYNNATEKTKIIYVGSLAGMLPGGPGHSHQSVRDIGILSNIPGLEMMEPSCEKELEMMFPYILETPASIYLRLISVPVAVHFSLPVGYSFKRGYGIVLREGSDAVLFAYGPVMLGEALSAAKLLEEHFDLSIKVINLPWLNVVDLEWLEKQVKSYSYVFTLDNHYVKGGQGEMIAATLAEHFSDTPRVVTFFGLREIPACGLNPQVLQWHGLDANSLAHQISSIIFEKSYAAGGLLEKLK